MPLSSLFRCSYWDTTSQSTTVLCQVLVSRKGLVSPRKCAQHGCAPQEVIEQTGTWYDRLVESAQCDGGRDERFHTPTLHKRNSRYFPRSHCREVEEIGTRLAKDCYTMQEYAALRPEDDPNSFGENLEFWLVAP